MLGADCGGLDPQVDCSCCTLCCDEDTGDCSIDVPRVCEIAAETMTTGESFGCGDGTNEGVKTFFMQQWPLLPDKNIANTDSTKTWTKY